MDFQFLVLFVFVIYVYLVTKIYKKSYEEDEKNGILQALYYVLTLI